MAATIAHRRPRHPGHRRAQVLEDPRPETPRPLLFAAARDDRTMVEVLRWVDLREDNEVAKLLEDAGVDGAITAWEASQSRTDKARDSVYGTAEDCWPSTPTNASSASPPATTWPSRTSWPATTPSTCTPRSTSSGGCGRCSRPWPCSWSRPPKNRPPAHRTGCWTRAALRPG